MWDVPSGMSSTVAHDDAAASSSIAMLAPDACGMPSVAVAGFPFRCQ